MPCFASRSVGYRASMERRTESAGKVAHAAVRGVVAAMSMSGMRALTTRLGLVDETPPEMITDEHAPGPVQRLPQERRDALIVLAHWVYGGIGGAGFGMLPERVRLQPWAGPVFGTVLWLGFEFALVPMLDLRFRNPKSVRQRLALAADHLLYGAVLAEFRRRPQR